MNTTSAATDRSMEALVGQVADAFVQRLNRGEQPEVEDYARRHPEIEGVLRQVLTALQLARMPADDSADADAEALGHAAVRGCLGDFRLLRELGRGGMGIVYEADQLSLSRKVALKVLPFAAGMDPRQLQRFKTEAQAAAQLHHQHIVPVYGVGCDRGVHYYAMQYIEGHTLAATIRELRRERDGINRVGAAAAVREVDAPPAPAPEATPPAGFLSTETSIRQPGFFRTVARLGAQAAEALEHAHQLGIVHRDIKPANLLVDEREKLWVTDFGLARVNSDAGLTMSGDLLGTLRYMSPEQALARHGLVDHRTDIYSLGATLYELLTLQPACPGDDRAHVLRQIERQDPRAPRSLNPAVPTDLETVVLKALAKEPDQRYATAQELADDLHRFLEDKPILAKRPTLWQRGHKWMRRHQGMVVTAGVATLVVLFTIVVALIVGMIRVRMEEDRTRAEHESAVAAQKRAEESYRLALEALKECVAKVREDPRLKTGELEDLRRVVLEAEAHFYQKLVRLHGDEPEFQAERGRAFLQLGYASEALGTPEEAIPAYEQAAEIFLALTQRYPENPQYRNKLARAHADLGVLYERTARWTEAEQAYERALSLRRELVRDQRAVAEYQAAVASTLVKLALVYQQAGRLPQAERTYQEGLACWEEFVHSHPTVRHYDYERAIGYHHLGALYMKTQRFRDAERCLREALGLCEAVAAAKPQDVRYRRALARTLNDLCYLYRNTERLTEAEEVLRKALVLKQALVKDHPKVSQYAVDLGGTQCNLGGLALGRGDHEGALQWLSQAIRTLEGVLARNPGDRRAREFLGNAYEGRRHTLAELGRHRESLDDANRLREVRNAAPKVEE